MYTPNGDEIPRKNQGRASIVLEAIRRNGQEIEEAIKIAQTDERPSQRETENRLASLWAYRRDLLSRIEELAWL